MLPKQYLPNQKQSSETVPAGSLSVFPALSAISRLSRPFPGSLASETLSETVSETSLMPETVSETVSETGVLGETVSETLSDTVSETGVLSETLSETVSETGDQPETLSETVTVSHKRTGFK